jgi:hypothetical protein
VALFDPAGVKTAQAPKRGEKLSQTAQNRRVHKIVIAWLRSGETFVLSIFIAAMFLHNQDPRATLVYRRRMLSRQLFTSGGTIAKLPAGVNYG